MNESRFRLRRHDPDRAHRKSHKALFYLKRAKDQLEDAVKLLRKVATESEILRRQTTQKSTKSDSFQINQTRDDKIPAWLSRDFLIGKQENLLEILGEATLRLEAGREELGTRLENPDSNTSSLNSLEDSQTLEDIVQALEFLKLAVNEMNESKVNLTEESYEKAVGNQTVSLELLSKAIEQFLDHKGLIEVAFREHQVSNAILQGIIDLEEDQNNASSEASKRALQILKSLETLEMTVGEKVNLGYLNNSDRLKRLEARLKVAKEKALEEATQGDGSQNEAQTPNEENKATDEINELYDLAEKLRKNALKSFEEGVVQVRNWSQNLETLAQKDVNNIDSQPEEGNESDRGNELERKLSFLTEVAKTNEFVSIHNHSKVIEGTLKQLRSLFFNLAEHLIQFHNDQSDTMDKVAETEQFGEEERSSSIQSVSNFQMRHKSVMDQLINATDGFLSDQSSSPGQEGQIDFAACARGDARSGKLYGSFFEPA